MAFITSCVAQTLRSSKTLRIAIVMAACLATHAVASAQSGPQSRARLTDKDFEAAMQGIANNLLDRYDNMPRIRVVLNEDRRFYDHQGQLHALAFYTRDHIGRPVIYVNPGYTNRASYKEMVETVMHELIHGWVDWRGIRDNTAGGHGEAFLRKAIQIGVNVDNTLVAFPGAIVIYQKLTTDTGLQTRTYVETRDRMKHEGLLSRLAQAAARTVRVRDPMKEEDFFGAEIYDFQFVLFDADGRSRRLNQRNNLVKTAMKPQIGQTYLWQNQAWAVYAITGSVIWLRN